MRSERYREVGRQWLPLAGATGCFLAVSAAAAEPMGTAYTVVAFGLAVFGGGLAGVWVRDVKRRTHATVALVLWSLVIAVAAGGAVVQGTAVGGPAGHGWTILLWTMALWAGVSTVYLGCREYGSPNRPTGTEDVL